MRHWLAKLEDGSSSLKDRRVYSAKPKTARHIAEVSPVYGEDPRPIVLLRFFLSLTAKIFEGDSDVVRILGA
eukprot:g28011.t1